MLGFASFDAVPELNEHELAELKKRDDNDAYSELGLYYLLSEKCGPDSKKKALELLQKAADAGHPKAQYNLGLCYKLGEVVSVNYKKAAEWFAKSAESGDTNALYQLAFCFFRGEGVIADHQRAVSLFTQAAELGHGEAATNLGLCYEDGDGVVPSLDNALKYYSIASEKGNVYAIDLLQQLQHKMNIGLEKRRYSKDTTEDLQ